MNIQRFTAPTSREALAKARLAFGDGTLILSNRPTENGVEVVATAEDALASLTQKNDSAGQKSSGGSGRGTFQSRTEVASKVEDDAAELAMSTLSFQDYVRERMMPTHLRAPMPERAIETSHTFSTPVTAQARKPQTQSNQSSEVNQGIAQELHAMKELIEDRFNALSWLGQARQNPIRRSSTQPQNR